MEDFGNNSNRSKLTQIGNNDRPKANPVTSNVNIKPAKKMFGNNFIAKDVKSSFIEVATGYWFTQFKNGLVTGMKKLIDLVFTGTTSNNNGTTNYNGIYIPKSTSNNTINYSRPTPTTQSASNQSVERFRLVTFPDRGEAEEVLQRMVSDIADYGMVDVGTFWEYIGHSQEVNQTDYDWGWRDLTTAHVERCPDGYKIEFPKIISLK